LIWSLDILQHKVEKDFYEKGKEIMIFPDIYKSILDFYFYKNSLLIKIPEQKFYIFG